MRICQVTHAYYPDLVGDVFGAHDFAKRILVTGNDCCAITWTLGRGHSVEEVIDGVDVVRLRGVNLKMLPTISEFPVLFGMNEAVQKLMPDLIQAQSHLFPPTLQAIRIAQSRNIPIVVTIRGLIAKRGIAVEAAQWAYIMTVCRKLLPKADLVVCLTRYERDALRSLGFQCEIEVIPNGVDTQMFKPRESKDPYLITWVGRMVPEKGLEFLLKAMALLRKEVPESKLVLVGDGPLMPRLKEMASRLVLGSSCTFLGKRSVREVGEILGVSSIFVLPSLREGLPKALLEAMSCGNAIVATDMPQLSEVVQEGREGTLVKIGYAAGLAVALRQLLQDQKRLRQYRSDARLKAVQLYEVSTMVERYIHAYTRLTGK
jgi:glycosyltransferase involved in cell wall biosynthesis